MNKKFHSSLHYPQHGR